MHLRNFPDSRELTLIFTAAKQTAIKPNISDCVMKMSQVCLNKALTFYVNDVRKIFVNVYNFSQREVPTNFIKVKWLKMSYDRKQFSEIVATKPHW